MLYRTAALMLITLPRDMEHEENVVDTAVTPAAVTDFTRKSLRFMIISTQNISCYQCLFLYTYRSESMLDCLLFLKSFLKKFFIE